LSLNGKNDENIMQFVMAQTNEKVLAYEDFVLFDSDLHSLTTKHGWLTDNVISFASSYIQNEMLMDETKEKICIVLPALCEMIKYAAMDDGLNGLLESFGISADKWTFFLLNDNTNPDMPCGGCHWILLVFDPTQRHFLVLDSLASEVDYKTRQFAKRVANLLQPDPSFQLVTPMPCPKMSNNGDCGMFLIAYLQAFLLSINKGTRKVDLSHINGEFIDEQRVYWKSLIDKLANKL
jgi:Ulp1 family protease